MLYQFYSAFIVGSLLAEKPRFIKTVRNLIDSNLQVGAENTSYQLDLLRVRFFSTVQFIIPICILIQFTTKQNWPDPKVHELYLKKIAVNEKRPKLPFYPAKEGIKKMQTENFAIHMDTATSYKIITVSYCLYD